LKVKKTSCFFL